jgi:hypothetical protein
MKTKKLIMILILSSLITLAIPLVSAAPSNNAQGKPGHLNDGTYVYVISQDKFYRTIVPVTGDGTLPVHGPFQVLPLSTMYGPGDQEYVGGRWVKDGNVYFLCPLLGPALDSIPT